jgi:hypothetical protein
MKHLFKKGYKMSEDTKQKIREWHLTHPLSKEHIQKIREAHANGMEGKKHSVETRQKMRLTALKNGNKPLIRYGKENHNWKGDKAGYWTLHKWIVKERGRPDTCEHCGKSGLKGRSIHWANKSRKYKRDLEDWLRLRHLCHNNE